MSILSAALALGGMSVVFGIMLIVIGKVFAVPANPLKDAVREALPGANCGGCGFPGCDGCADAISSGKAPVNACPVCSPEAVDTIAGIMGQEPVDSSNKMVATVLCQGDSEHCKNKFAYTGIQDCVAASLVNDGNRACKFACLGLGTCAKACPFDAIHIDEEKKIAVVDEEKCQSCGKCVAACPKNVIALLPQKQTIKVLCRNTGKGKPVKEACDKGCIGCGMCEKACKFGAITMVNNVPVIDAEKCVGCMMCAEKCPTKALTANFAERKIAEIDQELCVGCTICKKQCQFDAIEGELKQKHKVHDACTGCGACAAKCPKKAITMKVRTSDRDPKATAPKAE